MLVKALRPWGLAHRFPDRAGTVTYLLDRLGHLAHAPGSEGAQPRHGLLELAGSPDLAAAAALRLPAHLLVGSERTALIQVVENWEATFPRAGALSIPAEYHVARLALRDAAMRAIDAGQLRK